MDKCLRQDNKQISKRLFTCSFMALFLFLSSVFFFSKAQAQEAVVLGNLTSSFNLAQRQHTSGFRISQILVRNSFGRFEPYDTSRIRDLNKTLGKVAFLVTRKSGAIALQGKLFALSRQGRSIIDDQTRSNLLRKGVSLKNPIYESAITPDFNSIRYFIEANDANRSLSSRDTFFFHGDLTHLLRAFNRLDRQLESYKRYYLSL